RPNIFRIPKEKKCIIILSNCANQSAYDLFENTMKVFRRNEWIRPFRILSDTLYPIMQQDSIKSAIYTYKYLKKNHPTAYDYSSESLELFGERLMLLQKYQEAVAIFSLAVEEEPNFIYGYLHLGRAFEKLGEQNEAIKAYKIAVVKGDNTRVGNDAAFQLKKLNHN
ncbi:MAG: tetratricopeptide repeat protein, partial [Aquaticitalea sp.]